MSTTPPRPGATLPSRPLLTPWQRRRLWWRHTWTFQLAHGPLCARHRSGVVRLGRLHVCRSCLLLWSTALVAGAVAALTPDVAAIRTIGLVTAAVVLPLSFPPIYGRLPRLAKDVLRAGAGALIGLAAALVVQGAFLEGAVSLAVLGGLYLLYARARRRHRPRICDGCEELGSGSVCSGYRLQAEGLRAFEEAASAAAEQSWAAARTR